MTAADTMMIERVARVLAGLAFSANAAGTETSASDHVEAAWRDYEASAIAVLKSMRHPDPAMSAGGDDAVWGRMIALALNE